MISVPKFSMARWTTCGPRSNCSIPYTGVGVFVTVNETDFKGRRRENIVRARALLVDADGPDQVQRCEEVVRSTGAVPTAVVRTSKAAHTIIGVAMTSHSTNSQTAKPRSLREWAPTPPSRTSLGSCGCPVRCILKEPANPRLVTLDRPSAPPPRWSITELKTKLELVTNRRGQSRSTPATAYLSRVMSSGSEKRLEPSISNPTTCRLALKLILRRLSLRSRLFRQPP